MIIDIISKPYEKHSERFSFKPWQCGLLGSLTGSAARIISANWAGPVGDLSIRTVNMGRNSGHTYFAQSIALNECPVRTKIYIADDAEVVEQYVSLSFQNDICHEPIEVMTASRAEYKGQLVDVVVLDFGGSPLSKWRSYVESMRAGLPPSTMLLMLEPEFF